MKISLVKTNAGLKAATDFCKDKLELKSDDVLSLADKFLNWIQRK